MQNAEQDRTQRAAEAVADKKALDAAIDEFKSLKATDGQMRERLASLRTEFKKTLNSSVDILHRDREVRPGPAERSFPSPEPLAQARSSQIRWNALQGKPEYPTIGALRLASFFESPPTSDRLRGARFSAAD